MTTSERGKLLETYSQKATDAKPVGSYTPAQLIKLEQEWRIKLKKSGFSDYEMWDNKPHKNKKRIKFIKGHVRMHRYGNMPNFYRRMEQTQEYYRIIGLYAFHCPEGEMPEKYRALLQEYVQHGYRSQAIKAVAPEIKNSAIEMYLIKNLHKMIDFVRKLDNDTEDETRTDYTN